MFNIQSIYFPFIFFVFISLNKKETNQPNWSFHKLTGHGQLSKTNDYNYYYNLDLLLSLSHVFGNVDHFYGRTIEYAITMANG